MSAHRILVFLLIPAVSTFLSTRSQASEPGLPFTEDFAETTLRNATETTANWSTQEEATLLNLRGPIYGAFGPGLVGMDITAEEHDTSSLALGDMDGDGDLDLVEGNRNEPSRLYLNDGLVFPKGTIPAGFDITADARDTRSVAVGDLDGDGDLDVVTGNFEGTNRLYLNNGSQDPFFPAAVGSDITADADDTASVALGDLDGDGDLDLVAGNNGTPNRLYLNNGTSDPFAGVVGSDITSDASATSSVALGDLDSDGDLDLVVGNFQQPSQIYSNNGTDNPFAGVTGIPFAADTAAIGPIALGDFNGDGKLDIIRVGGEAPEFDQLYFNNGTANPFEGVAGVPLNSDEDLSFSVAVGDVDSDGDLDILIGNVGLFSEGGKNRLYLNNGTSEPFSDVMGTDLTDDINHTNALALGDIDGDGDLDAIAGNRNQRNRLYLNEGSPNPFGAMSGSDITAETGRNYSMAVGDMDGDGDLDLVAANELASPNRLYLNNGTSDPFAGVSGSDITADILGTISVALGDVDRDGDLDLVAGNYRRPSRLYLNNGTADPFAGVMGNDFNLDATRTTSVALGDMDGDGDLDLVTGNELLPSRLYLNNGTANPFAGVTGGDITADASVTASVALGDMDGDGDLDLVAGNYIARNRLYLNNGTADPFAGVAGSDISTDVLNTGSLALGDVDGDGDLDLVDGNRQHNRLYLNNGTADPFMGVMGTDIHFDRYDTNSVALGDLDGDGDLDIVAGNTLNIFPAGGVNRLYLNNGTSNPFFGVTGEDITADASQTYSVVLGDLDGDGDLDVVAGHFNQRLRLYLNGGSPDPFSPAAGSDVSADANPTRAIAVGDVDRDGDPDVVAGNFGQPNRLYLNNGKPDPFEGVAGENITADAQQTTSVALGDVDKDGDPDLVAGNLGQPNRLYPNNGTADPFAGDAGSDITSDASATTSVALGDIDRDGDEDLVGGNFGQPNRMYLNNGSPDPWNGVTGEDITDDSHNTNSVALGDVDRDGFLDLVAGNFGQPNRLYLNQMSVGPFSGGHEIDSATGRAVSTTLGDVDGDGDLDLIQGKGEELSSDPSPKMYLNNGTADPFAGAVGTNIEPSKTSTYSLILGDLDGDEDLDLVLNSFTFPMRLFLNNGTSDPFSGVAAINITSETQVVANAVHAVALGDLDGDEDLDIVASRGSFPLRLYLNNGSPDPFAGVAGVEITSDTGSVRSLRSLALADFDGDGDLDIAAGHDQFNKTNRLYLNNGTALPFEGVIGSDIASDKRFTLTLAAGDLNGDSRPDIVAGNAASPSFLYLNNGTANPFAGVSGVAINSTTLHNVSSTALGDIDKDGDLDVVLGAYLTDQNQIFLNNGDPDPFNGVSGIEIDSKIVGTEGLALGDMDGDGDLDLVVGNTAVADELFLNNLIPNPFLSGSDITSDADNTRSVAAFDMDRDGSLDIVAGNDGQPNRLYTRRRFNAGPSQATSLTVDTQSGDIHRIILETEQSLPPNTAIDYWVSSNGGLRWSLVHPAEIFSLPIPGSDLRWRGVMKSLSPVFSPRLETLFLDLAPGLKADPGSLAFMDRVPISGPSDPVTVMITNEGDSNVTISGVLLGGADADQFVFSNDSGEINLAPAGTRTFEVAFNPTSLGLKMATVTITSDDIDRPIVLVSLLGTGAEPPTPTFTPTPSNTPTPTSTPIVTPSATSTEGATSTPTPQETNYDIHPEPPDGVVNAGDLLEWLGRLDGPDSVRNLLFDFERFWQNAP